MKILQTSEDIVPLGDFKAKMSEMLRKLRTSHQPIVITQNGRPAAVVISPEDFDAWVERDRFVGAIREGLRDADAGRTVADGDLDLELEDTREE